MVEPLRRRAELTALSERTVRGDSGSTGLAPHVRELDPGEVDAGERRHVDVVGGSTVTLDEPAIAAEAQPT